MNETLKKMIAESISVSDYHFPDVRKMMTICHRLKNKNKKTSRISSQGLMQPGMLVIL